MTWNGTAMLSMPNISPSFGGIFFLLNPETGTHNIVGTWNTASKGLVIQAVSFAGVSGLRLGNRKSLNPNTTCSIDNVAMSPNSVLIDFCLTGDYPEFKGFPPHTNGHSQGSGQTQMLDFDSRYRFAGGSPAPLTLIQPDMIFENSSSYMSGSAAGTTDTMTVTFDSAQSVMVTAILESISTDAQALLL